MATKDVDVVFLNEMDSHAFESALEAGDFLSANVLAQEYRDLDATSVMERPDGMRFDIFVKRVCRKLRLTEGMRQRALELAIDGRLHLMATAPEDVFLFKSVTDREDDLADMALLAGLGLDWTIIEDELRGDLKNVRYLPHLVAKLADLEEVHRIVVPRRRELEREAEIMIGINIIDERIPDDSFTLSDVMDALGEDEEFSQVVLDRMVEMGIVQDDREGVSQR